MVFIFSCSGFTDLTLVCSKGCSDKYTYMVNFISYYLLYLKKTLLSLVWANVVDVFSVFHHHCIRVF